MITTIFELLYIILFLVTIVKYYQQKYLSQISELLSIVLFALILEYLSIKAYQAYHYSSEFIFQIGKAPDNVPIVIALAWGLIISVSMKFSDVTHLHEKKKPFMDTLTALSIDLSMDAIAIRIEGGFWSWKQELSNSINSDSFLGVRYGNFIGWYLIVLIFSSLLRYGRYKFNSFKHRQMKILYLSSIPFIAFIPFYIAFETIQQLKNIFNYSAYFPAIVLLLFILALYQIRDQRKEARTIKNLNLARLDIIIYYSFHSFFILTMIIEKFFQATPLLLITSLMAISFHFLIQREWISSNNHQNAKSNFTITFGD